MENATSLPDISAEDIPLGQLRDNLIDVTIALADELAEGGDRDRLETLRDLYIATKTALQQRDLRAAR